VAGAGRPRRARVGALPFDAIRDPWGLGIVLVYVYKETPFLVLLLLAAMGRSLGEREEAAAVLGAGPLQRVRWVVWPAIRAPLVVGAIVVMAFVIGAFEVPLAVGPNQPPMLAAYAFEATQGDVISGEQVAAATLVLTTVVAMVLAAVAVRLARTAEGA
jgi:putative spermidine/putrescine transport system permease protein